MQLVGWNMQAVQVMVEIGGNANGAGVQIAGLDISNPAGRAQPGILSTGAHVSAIHSSKNCDSKKRSSRSVLPVGGGPCTTEGPLPKFTSGAPARGGDLNGMSQHILDGVLRLWQAGLQPCARPVIRAPL